MKKYEKNIKKNSSKLPPKTKKRKTNSIKKNSKLGSFLFMSRSKKLAQSLIFSLNFGLKYRLKKSSLKFRRLALLIVIGLPLLSFSLFQLVRETVESANANPYQVVFSCPEGFTQKNLWLARQNQATENIDNWTVDIPSYNKAFFNNTLCIKKIKNSSQCPENAWVSLEKINQQSVRVCTTLASQGEKACPAKWSPKQDIINPKYNNTQHKQGLSIPRMTGKTTYQKKQLNNSNFCVVYHQPNRQKSNKPCINGFIEKFVPSTNTSSIFLQDGLCHYYNPNSKFNSKTDTKTNTSGATQDLAKFKLVCPKEIVEQQDLNCKIEAKQVTKKTILKFSFGQEKCTLQITQSSTYNCIFKGNLHKLSTGQFEVLGSINNQQSNQKSLQTVVSILEKNLASKQNPNQSDPNKDPNKDGSKTPQQLAQNNGAVAKDKIEKQSKNKIEAQDKEKNKDQNKDQVQNQIQDQDTKKSNPSSQQQNLTNPTDLENLEKLGKEIEDTPLTLLKPQDIKQANCKNLILNVGDTFSCNFDLKDGNFDTQDLAIKPQVFQVIAGKDILSSLPKNQKCTFNKTKNQIECKKILIATHQLPQIDLSQDPAQSGLQSSPKSQNFISGKAGLKLIFEASSPDQSKVLPKQREFKTQANFLKLSFPLVTKNHIIKSSCDSADIVLGETVECRMVSSKKVRGSFLLELAGDECSGNFNNTDTVECELSPKVAGQNISVKAILNPEQTSLSQNISFSQKINIQEKQIAPEDIKEIICDTEVFIGQKINCQVKIKPDITGNLSLVLGNQVCNLYFKVQDSRVRMCNSLVANKFGKQKISLKPMKDGTPSQAFDGVEVTVLSNQVSHKVIDQVVCVAESGDSKAVYLGEKLECQIYTPIPIFGKAQIRVGESFCEIDFGTQSSLQSSKNKNSNNRIFQKSCQLKVGNTGQEDILVLTDMDKLFKSYGSIDIQAIFYEIPETAITYNRSYNQRVPYGSQDIVIEVDLDQLHGFESGICSLYLNSYQNQKYTVNGSFLNKKNGKNICVFTFPKNKQVNQFWDMEFVIEDAITGLKWGNYGGYVFSFGSITVSQQS